MENKDTATISLQEYIRLMDFERNMKQGHTLSTWGHGGYHQCYITTNKAVERIMDLIKEKDEAIKEKDIEIHKLKKLKEELPPLPPIPKPLDVRNLSIWGFIKLKYFK